MFSNTKILEKVLASNAKNCRIVRVYKIVKEWKYALYCQLRNPKFWIPSKILEISTKNLF